MAVITESSPAIRYGIELDSYRAEAASKVLDHVIQGDALSAHARVESFGLTYCNRPYLSDFFRMFDLNESRIPAEACL